MSGGNLAWVSEVEVPEVRAYSNTIHRRHPRRIGVPHVIAAIVLLREAAPTSCRSCVGTMANTRRSGLIVVGSQIERPQTYRLQNRSKFDRRLTHCSNG